ncbi:MAG: hypothetical protein ACE5FN_11405 [Leptospirillia bacterium]
MNVHDPQKPGPSLGWLAFPALLLLLAGCGGGGGGVGAGSAGLGAGDPPLQACGSGSVPTEEAANVDTGSLLIVNDDAALSELVNCVDQEVALGKGVALGKAGGAGPYPHGIRLTLVAEVEPPVVLGSMTFSGNGNDDLTVSGTYDALHYRDYRVEIDGVGEVDTFRWSDDGGLTWAAEGVAMGDGPTPMSHGLSAAFEADSGHALGDAWSFTATTLQATSVEMKGDATLVSYAVAGAPRIGGIQVFRHFNKFPVLRSQAIYRDTEINAVSHKGGAVFGAGASSRGDFDDPAVLERLGLSGSRLTLNGYARMGLPSYAGTGVAANGNAVYGVSGSDGGVTAFGADVMDFQGYIPLADARWADVSENTLAVVSGGASGGMLTTFPVEDGGALGIPEQFPFDGADELEAKTTVEVVHNKAVVSAGSAGVQVISLVTGEVLATVPVPVVAGLAPEDVVANAVTVDRDLMFISFGGAGVYAARADRNFHNDDVSPMTIEMLGEVGFGDFISANHVEYKAGYLMVAAGFGGLKVVKVEHLSGHDDDGDAHHH